MYKKIARELNFLCLHANPVLVKAWTKRTWLPKVLFYKLHKFIPFLISAFIFIPQVNA